MKIALEEALKRATPGLVTIKDGGHHTSGRWFVCVPDGHCIAECNHDGVSTPDKNAALLAHCRNNFAEVVEALDWLANHKSSHETKHAEAHARDVLAKVTQVEVP
jgi:hypothetical protein